MKTLRQLKVEIYINLRGKDSKAFQIVLALQEVRFLNTQNIKSFLIISSYK